MAETTKKPFTLQLLRNADTSIGRTQAINKLKDAIESKIGAPGQPILSYYSDEMDKKYVLLGFSGADNTEIFESSTAVNNAISSAIDSLIGNADPNYDTLGKLQSFIQTIMSDDDTKPGSILNKIKTELDELDFTKVGDGTSTIITSIEQINGQISATKRDLVSTNNTINIDTSSETHLGIDVKYDNETIVKNDKGNLSVASAALTQYIGEDAIEVSDEANNENNKSISLKLNDANKILSQSENGLLASLKLELVEVEAVDETPKHMEIQLQDGEGNRLDGIDATEFIADGMIEKVEVIEKDIEGKQVEFLKITWNAVAGENVVEVNLGKYIDIYTAGVGIEVNNNEISVKVVTNDKYIEVTENGVASKGIDDAIKTAIEDLDKDDEAVVGQYVNAVSEADGIITVTRANISDAKLNTLADDEITVDDITTEDTLKLALAKLQKRIAELELYNNSFDTIECGVYHDDGTVTLPTKSDDTVE